MRGIGWTALCLLTVAACGTAPGAGGQVCTDTGGRTGISVELDEGAPIPESTESVALTLCVDGSCQDVSVQLAPATGTGATGCSGDVCSAQVVPTGGRVGFAEVSSLTKKLVDVKLTAGGREFRTTVTPRSVYPNGPDCGASGVQGRIGLSAEGNLASR